ncbi:Hsp70 chaperone protein, partial [Fusarium subglutinans]
RGDVFTILDAGGGTCDALTYIVTRKSPLRLERQLVHHSGGTCGSNALNAAFRELLENLLADHDYFNKDGATLEGHICKLAAHDFEHYLKTGWAVSQNSQDRVLEVFGLRSDPGSRNQATDNQQPCPHTLTIQAEHLNNIYRRVCDEVSMLMTKQLHETTQLGLKTGKVVLAGGFGESKPLRTCLREALASFNAAQNSNVELHVAGEHERTTAVDAVSSGGVLRALDKLYGPTRVANSSYGVRCDELFLHAMHAGQPTIQGRDNAQELFVEAIQWITKKTSLYSIPPSFQISAPRCCTFPFWNDDGTINKGPFTCQEEIWVSDAAYLDHHSYLHEHNKDAQKIGVFSTDVTHLHQDFLLEGQGAQASGGTRYLYWRFPYKLVLTIDGLNMKSAVRAEICKLGTLRYRH